MFPLSFHWYTELRMSVAQQEFIERIHASGKQLVLALTGGGSGAISALLEVSGASASVLEATVPYAETALERWLGGPPDQACSERTARAMAMAAFERARTLTDADPRLLRGIGATASLATNRPKRGPHRIHVAWQSADTTAALSLELPKGERTRGEEEPIATALILEAVAEACGIDSPRLIDPQLLRGQLPRHRHIAAATLTELLLGERACVAIPGHTPKVLFPGAFNPLHSGHEQMAALAAARCGAPVTFELSLVNVDKPPLDFIELSERLQQLIGHNVLVTRAATFAEKARLVPGCVFVVGVDTIARIGKPEYYNHDASLRDAAVDVIVAAGCRFLVFARFYEGKFCALGDLELPRSLRELCDEVPESIFRADIASRALREG